MSLSKSYTDPVPSESTYDLRARRGGPRKRPSEPIVRDRRFNNSIFRSTTGSHMPIDTDIHWDWGNPLNIIPITLLILIALATLAAIL